jgi:hypothetical protein
MDIKDMKIELKFNPKLLCIKDCEITSGLGNSKFIAGNWYDQDYKYPGLSGSTLNMCYFGSEHFITYEVYEHMKSWCKLINEQKK